MDEFTKEIGMSKDALAIYKHLLEHGFSKPSKISIKTGIQRSYVYKLLEELAEMKLVGKKKSSQNRLYFYPLNPRVIGEMINKRKDEIEVFTKESARVLTNLTNAYNKLEDKPTIKMYSGIAGLKEIYADILTDNKSLRILRSTLDASTQKTDSLIAAQKKLQVQSGLGVQLISPPRTDLGSTNLHKKDTQENIERRIIRGDDFNNKSQVLIYKNKVAITGYDKDIHSILIESKEIAQTFNNIFDFMWNKGEYPY